MYWNTMAIIQANFYFIFMAEMVYKKFTMASRIKEWKRDLRLTILGDKNYYSNENDDMQQITDQVN